MMTEFVLATILLTMPYGQRQRYYYLCFGLRTQEIALGTLSKWNQNSHTVKSGEHWDAFSAPIGAVVIPITSRPMPFECSITSRI